MIISTESYFIACISGGDCLCPSRTIKGLYKTVPGGMVLCKMSTYDGLQCIKGFSLDYLVQLKSII